MYCNACGANIAEGQQFCGKCGRMVQGSVQVLAPTRIASNITLLGALWIAYSVLTLVGGLVLIILSRTLFAMINAQNEAAGAPGFLRPLLAAIGMLVIVKGAFSFVAGWGLLRREPWARILALVIGCLSLLNIPFGTALGIYTLWVLLSQNGEAEYRALAQQGC